MDKKIPGVVQVVGGLVASVGFASIYRPLGVIVAGLLAIVFGVALEGDG